MSDLALFLPELVVLAGALVLFVLSVLEAPSEQLQGAGLIAALGATVASFVTLDAVGEPFFEGIYKVDHFSQLLKLGLTAGLTLVMLLSRELRTVRRSVRPDVPFFLFVSTAGMMLLVSATELLTLYVALELSAYGLFILVALHKKERMGSEAGAKYIIYGAASSALTLYGLSLIFGATGTTYLAGIHQATAVHGTPIFLVGVLLGLSGFFFKLAVFPFHGWAPDTYEGSPHEVTAFVGTVSKVAAAGVLVRACTMAQFQPGELAVAFAVLAVVSMTFGNLAALVQRDLKRLLAYSTVAHAGYMMVGLYAFSQTGVASVLFYSLAYLVMAFGAFLVVCVLGRDGSNPTFDTLRGLHHRSPFLALVLLVSMFGLAGIPPTPGFAGKWFLFSAALERGQFLLVLFAAVNATVSLYYYLMVVKAAYLDPADGEPGPLTLRPLVAATAFVALVATTVLGFYPTPLWDLAVEAASAVIPL